MIPPVGGKHNILQMRLHTRACEHTQTYTNSQRALQCSIWLRAKSHLPEANPNPNPLIQSTSRQFQLPTAKCMHTHTHMLTYKDIITHISVKTPTHTHSSKNTLLCTHIESCVPVSKEGERNRDLHEPGASVVLRDGLGVPLVLAKGVEVLQGHSEFHPRQQVQGEQGAEAGQQGLQHQHHGLSHPGMELTAGTAEGREEHTHLRQTRAEQNRTRAYVPPLNHSSLNPPLTALWLCLFLPSLVL